MPEKSDTAKPEEFVYAQVYDEAKEQWVLRKVPALGVIEVIRRRVRRGDQQPNRAHQCLNCRDAFLYHVRNRDGWFICSEAQVNDPEPTAYFEW